jgi:hypothetical protein
VAIFPLKNNGGLTEGEINIFSDRISYEVSKNSLFRVVERTQINDILKEQGFQQSGACTDEACLVEMVQVLAVQKIVTGSIGKMGSLYSLNVKIINVSTGVIEKQIMEDMKESKEAIITKRVPEIVKQLIASETAALSPRGKNKTPKASSVKGKPSSASAATPSDVQPAGNASPLLRRPIFWIGTGTLVAASVAAVVLSMKGDGSGEENLDPVLDEGVVLPGRPGIPAIR